MRNCIILYDCGCAALSPAFTHRSRPLGLRMLLLRNMHKALLGLLCIAFCVLIFFHLHTVAEYRKIILGGAMKLKELDRTHQHILANLTDTIETQAIEVRLMKSALEREKYGNLLLSQQITAYRCCRRQGHGL